MPVPSSSSAAAPRQSLGGMPFAGVGRGPGMGGEGIKMGNKTVVKYEGSEESSDGETVVMSVEEFQRERRRREERKGRRKESR